MDWISVLLPTHNAEATLPEALACLRSQRGLDARLEIVLADDGSTDRTLAVANNAAAADPRMRVLPLPHRGIAATLNAALAQARGNLVARMDADDLCSADRLSLQLRHLRRHPCLDVVGTGVRMFPPEAVSPNMRAYLAWQNRLLIHRALVRNLLVESPLTHATALFRRDALERIGGWRPVPGPEDVDLWLRGAEAGWRFGKVNRVLYLWREHPARLTRTDPRMSRDAFRRLALDAAARWIPPSTAVVLWGWGESLTAWRAGLESRGARVTALAVNPRRLRGGTETPSLPQASRTSRGEPTWLLAYGARRSRRTLSLWLARRGARPGIHYRFVS